MNACLTPARDAGSSDRGHRYRYSHHRSGAAGGHRRTTLRLLERVNIHLSAPCTSIEHTCTRMIVIPVPAARCQCDRAQSPSVCARHSSNLAKRPPAGPARRVSEPPEPTAHGRRSRGKRPPGEHPTDRGRCGRDEALVIWRRGWDSNPRGAQCPQPISSRCRYDHFGTSP